MLCWARYCFVVVVIALGTLSMVEACGQRGPLFLPKPDAEQPPTKGTGKGTEVPKTPAPATTQTPRPAEGPDGCTSRCSQGSN